MHALKFRYDPMPADAERVRRMVRDTGFFRADEVDVAEELVLERLARGRASGYEFVLGEIGSEVVGYSCFGPIACTLGSFDLYWIVVDESRQRHGIGSLLLEETERLVRDAAGRHIYIETSGRAQYEPTRGFYLRQGYEVIAVLPEFYDLQDDKVILRKVL